MERNTLEKFFTGKHFVIPSYQRDYTWTQQNIDDLLNDIAETIETKTSHYIGTFILSRQQGDGAYHVVDGQQRLTTLTMILNAVIAMLPNDQQLICRNTFVQDVAKKRWRLEPADYNRAFLADLLQARPVDPQSKSQRLLLEAYRYIVGRIAEIHKRAGGLDAYLDSLKQLEVMEFIEADEGKAIRIFQTVNDRGRPLAVIEKAKSLLIYYSNRFLSGELDGAINTAFGGIYKDFCELKEIAEAEDTRIDLLALAGFSEDSVMRYHFLGFPSEFYDFKPSTDYVLDGFLKKTLKSLQVDKAGLKQFVAVYVADLRRFFGSLLKLVERVRTEPRYYKMFCMLGLSTHLYPLVIRLQGRGILDQPATPGGLTFADLVEIADVRIYKTRGTDPQKDISHLACDAATADPAAIRRRLAEIVTRFMDDGRFESDLRGNMYGNEALLHILMEHGEAWACDQGKPSLTVDDLIALKRTKPTIEHVFAQTPGFTLPGRGFATQDQYLMMNDCLGNLTVLEREINSRCQNKTPEQKLDDANLFKASKFDVSRALVAEVAASGSAFDAKCVEDRTRRLADFAKQRWPLWEAD